MINDDLTSTRLTWEEIKAAQDTDMDDELALLRRTWTPPTSMSDLDIDRQNADLAPTLINDGDTGADWTLTGDDCWITVGSIAVWINNRGDGVTVHLLPNGNEADADPIDTALAYFSESKAK